MLGRYARRAAGKFLITERRLGAAEDLKMKFYYSDGGPWIAMRARSMGAAKAAARKLAGGDCVLGQKIPFNGIEPVACLSGGHWVESGVMRQEVKITVTITCDADVILDHAQLKRAPEGRL